MLILRENDEVTLVRERFKPIFGLKTREEDIPVTQIMNTISKTNASEYFRGSANGVYK